MPQLAIHLQGESRLDPPPSGLRALEHWDFPFEAISDIAERESWRKEINRPIYHVHKWWAQRLGSVFRAIIIGALSPAGTNVLEQFYSQARFPGSVIFDPFMGSGTTLGEALKLGCRAVGRDINPVAAFAVRNALEKHSREQIEQAFNKLSEAIRPELESYYRCRLPDGSPATTLYYFWTKVLPCPACAASVDLMGSRIFARHAYPKRHPESRALCPNCGEINTVHYESNEAVCRGCQRAFDPSRGNAYGTKATCPCCAEDFPIAAVARNRGQPPTHRLYAKLVLTSDGRKLYLRADDFDHAEYRRAEERLGREDGLFPVVKIEPGYNTNQVLNYGYTYWHEMFNARQLLCLGLLAREIGKIELPEVRDAFVCLFSGALEFNNMFASYKGEGTGAVRHMFYHHILKPERTPLEANLWGTSKSSGSFSGLYRSRLLRALDYASNPFEILPDGGKVFGLSNPIGAEGTVDVTSFKKGGRLYISCGDSAAIDLEENSVDAIITDPPFFDNVNYSQLADFFHVWQRHILPEERPTVTTRSSREVQHQDAGVFSSRLGDVLTKCHRVLRDGGVLAFSYHHSRGEGWASVLHALKAAGFVVSASVPVKAEMSGATPKNQAREPIDLDIILVCRKTGTWNAKLDVEAALTIAGIQVNRLQSAGRKLSRNDTRIILMGQLLRCASAGLPVEETVESRELESWIDKLHG